MARRAKKITIGHLDTAEKTRKPPSFFTVLLTGFETQLDIPTKAMGSFGSEDSYVMLKTKVGSWAVRFNKTGTRTGGEGGICLQGRGWADFVRDNAFTIGDFLAFFFEEGERDGVYSLKVLPFGQTSCLKPPPKPKAATTTTTAAKRGRPVAAHKPPPKATATAKSGPASVHKSVTSYFEVTFTRFNLFALFVPPEFVAETGMLRRTRVAVMDWKGREWSVIVSELSSGGVRIGFGWAEFVKANALQVGMTCLFQTSYLPDGDAVVEDDVFVLVANLIHF